MKKIFYLLLFVLPVSVLSAQELTQTIRGKVTDKETNVELGGVNIFLFKDSSKVASAVTSANGTYRLEKIPVGKYILKANFLGYQPTSIKGIVVSSAKEVILNFEIEESAVKVNEVVINAGKKGEVKNDMASVSARVFSVEETNRYAGSRSDPARMASNFAGVQGTDDSRNDIVVRGNSPLGILWRLEDVDIPNPNHFAVAGSTGGPINLINNKSLANSSFYTGAFPAEFGNANAGIFDLKMRNGNNEKHEFTGQFGLFGTEVAAEGPLKKSSGSSYMLTYRYATLKLFEALNIRLGTTAVPNYQDASFKFNFPGKKRGNFSLFGVGGKSNIDILVSNQTEPTEEIYGDKDRDQYFGSSIGIVGASYTQSLNDKTFMKVVVAQSANETHSHHVLVHRDTTFAIDSLVDQLRYRFAEQRTSLNFFINHKYNSKASIKAGFLASYYNFDMLDSNRNSVTYKFEVRTDYRGNTGLLQPFVQFRLKTSDKFVLTAGLHGQYFSMNGSSSIEPRAGMKWNIKNNQTLSFGTGLHSQMQPSYVYFTQLETANNSHVIHNKGLGFTRSFHNILSYDLALSENLRIKTEAYYQYLYQVPIDIYSSSFSLLNQGSGFDRFFPDTLTNKGTGNNYGVELTIEKFFSKSFFYMITASLFDSKYKGSDGVERNTDFNGNFAFNGLLAKEFKIGKSKNSVLTTGTKVTYAGGRRYTPADTLQSAIRRELVGIDSLKNTLQFKHYFRWDVKVGIRINKKKVTHEIGLDLVNVLNTQNILALTYAPNTKNPTDVIRQDYQLGFLPVFYYKIDF